jgi:desulfoferrodoxin (superoxide reductase-like protein)
MSPDTIRLRRGATHADHTPVLAQDRATAVAHIHVAAGDTHRTATEDHHPTAVEVVLHRTAEAVEVTANRNHLPAIANDVKPCFKPSDEHKKSDG